MKIKINNASKISDIQKVFSSEYPYLKISFFSKPHAVGKASAKKLMVDDKMHLNEVRRKKNEGEVEITGTMKVSDLESVLWNEYGLSVQVFRKSGNSWLETTATDYWTLEKQNRLGEDISNFKNMDETEEFDNDRTK